MENIEKKLCLYSLYSKDTETYSILVMGYDDKETIKYYQDSFNSIYTNLNKYYTGDKLIAESKNLQDKVKDSCIYRVGFFDEFKGEFVNDKYMLVDLFNYKLKKIKEDKK